MGRLILMFVIVSFVAAGNAETSILEKFFASGFSKEKETADANQNEENTGESTVNNLVKFMKRAGLVKPDEHISNKQRLIENFQKLTPQQQAIFLLQSQLPHQSQLTQQSKITNYVVPRRQLLLPQQKKQLTAQTSESLDSDSSSKSKSISQSDSQQVASSKPIIKADRQGFYTQDGTLYEAGYSGHEGYVDAKDGYSDDHDTYSGSRYAPEPIYHKPEYHPPPPKAASVAIKIDPIGILRLLLAGLPKPLLNLNGKVFLGVELGKHAGIGVGKGVGYAPHPGAGHYPPKGIVLNLG